MNSLVHLQPYFLWAIKELILANKSGSDKTKVIVSITSLSLTTTSRYYSGIWDYFMEVHITMLSYTTLFLSACNATLCFFFCDFRGSSEIPRRIMGYLAYLIILSRSTNFIRALALEV